MVVPAFYILGVFPKDYNTCNSTEWPLLFFCINSPPFISFKKTFLKVHFGKLTLLCLAGSLRHDCKI